MVRCVYMEKADSTNFIIFDVDEMQYALPIEYAAFIVMATEEFPTCIPPRIPRYVKCIMQMEQGLVPVIDFTWFTAYCDSDSSEREYPLILILNHRNKQVGILTDHVTIQPVTSEPETQREAISQQLLVNFGEKKPFLLDVPTFFEKLGAGQIYPSERFP